MSDLQCDVAVIGAGTAGISAERAARGAGASTLLIDPNFAGTVCATVGCMPSKLLLAAAKRAHHARTADIFGISAPPQIDGKAVMQRLRHERDRFAQGVRDGFKRLPQGVAITARARFSGPNRLLLDDGRSVTAARTVIATGSAPAIPGPFQHLGDLILTNDSIFELPDLPASLAVIGAGVIGLELAQAMARLGVRVAVFDRADQIRLSRQPAINQAIAQALGAEFAIHHGSSPTPSRVDGKLRLDWGAGRSDMFDHVLIAAGRPPQVAGLDLDRTGATLDERGMPTFDDQTMQIEDLPIFIAGDVNGARPVLHEASQEGAIAGRNAARFPQVQPFDRSPQFTITFTDPPIARIGKGPDDAACVGLSDYGNQGRARVEDQAQGSVHLYADGRGRLIGADLFAPGGDHLAHLLLWAVIEGATATELLNRPFYHPTLEEGLRSALRQICKASDIALPPNQDRGNPPGS